MLTLQQRSLEAKTVTLLGLFINLALFAFKLLAGIFGRSAAMVADAVHSLSDFATDIVVLVGVKMSAQPEDKEHAYGHGRFETLATALIAIVLFAVGGKILLSGIDSIISIASGNLISKPHLIALVAAVLSIVLKEWLYRYTLNAAERIDSQALTANAWHHRSDALSSVGTLCGIAGAYFLGQKWVILDPLAAVIVSFFIFEASWHILKTVGKELLEASLGEKTEKEILSLCAQLSAVIQPHDIKTRRIGNRIAIEMHIYLRDDTSFITAHHITEELEDKIKEKFGPQTFVTIHPEPASSRGSDSSIAKN